MPKNLSVGRDVKSDVTMCSKFTGAYDPVYYCWLVDPCVEDLNQAPRFLYSETCSGSGCEPLPSEYASCSDWTMSDAAQSCAGYGPFATCCKHRTCSSGQVCVDLVPGAAFCKPQPAPASPPAAPSPPAPSSPSPSPSALPLLPPSGVPEETDSSPTDSWGQEGVSGSSQADEEPQPELAENVPIGTTAWSPPSDEPLSVSPPASILPLLSPVSEQTGEEITPGLDDIDSPSETSPEEIPTIVPVSSASTLSPSQTATPALEEPDAAVDSSPFLLPLLSQPQESSPSSATTSPEEAVPAAQRSPAALLPLVSPRVEPSPQGEVEAAPTQPVPQSSGPPPGHFVPTIPPIPVRESPSSDSEMSASPNPVAPDGSAGTPTDRQSPIQSPVPTISTLATAQPIPAPVASRPKEEPSWTTAFIILVAALAVALAAVILEKRNPEYQGAAEERDEELAVDEGFWNSLAAKKQYEAFDQSHRTFDI